MRHTAATLLKKIGASPRDAQLILGHSTVTITQNIYQHDDLETRADALAKVEGLFMRAAADVRCRQTLPPRIKIRPTFAGLTTFFYLAGVSVLEPNF